MRDDEEGQVEGSPDEDTWVLRPGKSGKKTKSGREETLCGEVLHP